MSNEPRTFTSLPADCQAHGVGADPAATLCIDVVLCLAPRELAQFTLQLSRGTTVGQASEQALQRWQDTHNAHNAQPWPPVDGPWQWGVWGRVVPAGQVLQPGDRLEAYRVLKVDPKVARRERFAQQGARGAGLFAQRRKDSKPGY